MPNDTDPTDSAMVSLAGAFAAFADGRAHQPRTEVLADSHFLDQSPDLRTFHDSLQANMGPFFRHFCASVPFVLEELCRVGLVLSRLTRHPPGISSFLELAGFDGSNARTLSELNDNALFTLTNSPNPQNKTEFFRRANGHRSLFHCGHFTELSPTFLRTRPDLHLFANGFDVIHENNCFQFCGPDRRHQISHVRSILKSDGLLILLEKLNADTEDEYQARESTKDTLFKTRYFTSAQIAWKRTNVVAPMRRGQVDMPILLHALHSTFPYVYLVWASTNFYEFVASTSLNRINDFLAHLVAPHVPSAFRSVWPPVQRLESSSTVTA